MADSTDSTWIGFHRQCTSPRLRLLCFPHAGGSAAVFRTWTAHLPAGVDIAAVQLPGRDQRAAERPVTSAHHAGRGVADALHELSGTAPWVLFGHSVGALIAYECAQHLNSDRPSLAHRLVVAASHPPQSLPIASRHALPDQDLLDLLAETGGLPAAVAARPRIAALWLPRLRTDLQIYDTYTRRDASRLTCPLTVLVGRDDPIIARETAEPWRQETTGPSTIRTVPGAHFFPLTHPRETLTATLSQSGRP